MILSELGVQLIAKFEDVRLQLYNDPTGNCTIAIGHMVHSGPCNGSEPQAFKQGITTQQAYDLLKSDAQKAADCVASHVTVPLNQAQIDALISFVYNVGCGAFSGSDLLTLLNQGNYRAVPVQLMRWVHGTVGGKPGVVLPGLVTRREAEGVLFASQQGGSVLSLIPNFPIVSQLTTVTGDGKPSENAQQDCTAASIDAVCRFLLGKPENSVFNPDYFKDAAYGDAWKGGTAAIEYIPLCKSLGINLHHVDASDPSHVVALAHQFVQKGIPAIFTELDPYVDTNLPQYRDWTHVCVFYGDDAHGLTAMDPYIAKPVYKSDASWIQGLRSNQLWIAERIEDVVTIDLNTSNVSNYFELVNGNQWRCKQTQKIIHGAILTEYCKYGNAGLAGLTFLGLPKSNEVPIPNASPCVKQYFERGVLVYDPIPHKLDNPPGAGDVYNAQLYGGLGQDPAVSALQKQVTDLQAQLANQQQTSNPDPIAAIHAVQAAVAPFK